MSPGDELFKVCPQSEGTWRPLLRNKDAVSVISGAEYTVYYQLLSVFLIISHIISEMNLCHLSQTFGLSEMQNNAHGA